MPLFLKVGPAVSVVALFAQLRSASGSECWPQPGNRSGCLQEASALANHHDEANGGAPGGIPISLTARIARAMSGNSCQSRAFGGRTMVSEGGEGAHTALTRVLSGW